MTSDITVALSAGTYRLTAPLQLTGADSGRNGYSVIYTSAPGVRAIISGAKQVTGWSVYDAADSIWSAALPPGATNRDLFMNGVAGDRASGSLPGELTPTPSGYVDNDPSIGSWPNPSQLQFDFAAATGSWTRPSCPVASIKGGHDHHGPAVLEQPDHPPSGLSYRTGNGLRDRSVTG